MKYLSVCSGLEAATLAWHPLGWTPAAFSDIGKFPRAVLKHHYPEVPLHGDFRLIKGDEHGTIDLIAGGTPCQDFSIAGLRKGIAGDRGNLTLEFIKLVERTGAKWVVWENVTGVLSSDEGRAFAAFLGGLAECGFGFAYRILDAQYFGVPQRRRRVFVIGYLGDWRPAAAVLFERESLRGDAPPCRESGQRIRCGYETSPTGSGYTDIAPTLDTRCKDGPIRNQLGLTILHDLVPEITGALDCGAHPGSYNGQDIYNDKLIPMAFYAKGNGTNLSEVAPTMMAGGFNTSHANSGNWIGVKTGKLLRRLTPRECERLQGIPDDYTLVPYGRNGRLAQDGPRYAALGNSMAVPVMHWLGRRIEMVNSLLN